VSKSDRLSSQEMHGFYCGSFTICGCFCFRLLSLSYQFLFFFLVEEHFGSSYCTIFLLWAFAELLEQISLGFGSTLDRDDLVSVLVTAPPYCDLWGEAYAFYVNMLTLFPRFCLWLLALFFWPLLALRLGASYSNFGYCNIFELFSECLSWRPHRFICLPLFLFIFESLSSSRLLGWDLPIYWLDFTCLSSWLHRGGATILHNWSAYLYYYSCTHVLNLDCIGALDLDCIG
jgi:hypothetical protein